MSDLKLKTVSRLTAAVHEQSAEKAMAVLKKAGINSVLVENARCVRQNVGSRFLNLLGINSELSDIATVIFRITVPQDMGEPMLSLLTEELGLYMHGRGSLYVQDVEEITPIPESVLSVDKTVSNDRSLRDLSLITGIQSLSSGGVYLAKVALRLGAGVPIVSLGTGTGIRDRLGLLRITISPEKELLYLMVPEHDANGLQGLLIEEGHLNRPGGGFLYQTPIRAGIVDSLMRIGRQEHAANLEQIIAAIDDMKKSTAWRKRNFGQKYDDEKASYDFCELSFVCREGQSDFILHAAIDAGAEGATMSKVRLIKPFDEENPQACACERGILCIPAAQKEAILGAMYKVTEGFEDKDWTLQSVSASSAFSHKSKGKKK